MGSRSDWDTMQHAAQILQQFAIGFEARVVSAHRMPDDMFAYAESAAERGLKAIIAGAGGAAHLPGMLAAKTTVPVLGVPVAGKHLQGVDALHSMVQMPKGIPGCHLCHWQRRCRQRRPVCRGPAGQREHGTAQRPASLSPRANRSRPRHAIAPWRKPSR